jgi:hypothetical protein
MIIIIFCIIFSIYTKLIAGYLRRKRGNYMLSEIISQIEEIIGDKRKTAAVVALIKDAEHKEKNQRFQKQIEGIAAAKERGVQFGRPLMDFPKNFAKICKKQQEGMLTVTEASRALNISRQQFYRLRKRYEGLHQK